MKHIKLIAVNLDKILIRDTYSPVIRKLILRKEKGHCETNSSSFETDYPENGIDATPALIDMLTRYDTSFKRFGSIKEILGNKPDLIKRNELTYNLKPVLEEIIKNIYQLDYSEALLIDDNHSVAKAAKELNIPFVGCSLNSGWQSSKIELERSGARFIVDSIDKIDQILLNKVDSIAQKRDFWSFCSFEMLQKAKNIIIDYDGVISKKSVRILFDFTVDYINSITTLPPAIIEAYMKIITAFPLRESVEMFMKAIGLSSNLKDFLTKCSELNIYKGNKVEIDDDFTRFIQYCKDANLQYYILSMADKTTSRMKSLEGIVDGSAILSADNRSKADPAFFNEIVHKISAAPYECLVIDDSPLALRSAKLAGLSTIMMLNELFNDDDYYIFEDFINFKVKTFDDVKSLFHDETNRIRWSKSSSIPA